MTPIAVRMFSPLHRADGPSRGFAFAARLVLTVVLGLLLHSGVALADEPTGMLTVAANVDGAAVWVDGVEAGTIPYVGYFPAGRHVVRVVKDHYDPYVRKVDMREELTTRVEAQLVAGRGTIEFSVQPAGATVEVDGNVVGPAPIRIRDLAQGNHRWRISADGHEAVRQTFSFTTGENLVFEVELRESAGLLEVNSTPEGATVWLDGETVGVTPIELEGIELGEHRVRLHLDGYADVFRPVDTSDGTKGELAANLTDQGSRLTIKTGSVDAQVSIDGTPIGQGKKVVLPSVDRGTVRVRVEASGVEPAVLSVRVGARSRHTIKARLKAADRGESELVELPPVYARWTFWAASAAVVGGGVTGAVLLAKALEPPPPPEGDVVVVLP